MTQIATTSLITPPMRVGFMLDSESLDLLPSAVMTSLAVVAFDLDDPDTILDEVEIFLPGQPQLDLGRTISFDTIGWWMNQPDMMRNQIQRSVGGDRDLLETGLHLVSRWFRETAGTSEYQVWCRRPQHDMPMLQSLLRDVGMNPFWRYDTVNDLSSIMTRAGVKKGDVDKTGFILHTALGDAKFQLKCLIEADSRLARVR